HQCKGAVRDKAGLRWPHRAIAVERIWRWRRAMKNGFRVYDVDTHINPGAEVLDRYVDPSFRPRLPELAPYKVAIRSREEGGGERSIYRFDEKIYERTL